MADRDEDALRQFLAANGFRFANNTMRNELNSWGWYAYRRSAIPARECELNDGKPMQIIVWPYRLRIEGCRPSVEVEVSGEAGGAWFKLRAYSIAAEELPAKLAGIEAGLIAAWNVLPPAFAPANEKDPT